MQLSSRPQASRQRFAIDRHTLLAAAVITGILLAVPAVTFLYVGERLDPLLVLAGIIGVIVALSIFRVSERSKRGIVLLLIAAGALSFVSLPTGRESRIPISMLIALALVVPWLLSMLWGKPPTRLKPSPINRPLIAFVAVSIISHFWSQIFRDPLLFVWSSFPMVQVAALAVNILLPLTLLYVANQVTDVRWLKYLVAVVLVFGVASLALSFIDPRTGDLFFYRGTRGLFSMWAAAFAYGLALFHKGLKPWQRALLLALVLLLAYRYFFLGRSWVSGWLPLGLALVVITWMRSRKLFLIFVTIGLIYLAANFEFYYQNIVVSELEGGSSERLGLWLHNLTHVANHPLFGMGPAGYAPYNMTYHADDARSTHNNYFDILAQTGVIGFVAFLLIIAQLWRVGLRSVRHYAGRRDFEEMYAVVAFSGVFGMVAGMMLGDWALPFAYNETIAGFDNAVLTWVLLGGMVALEMMRRMLPAQQSDARSVLSAAAQGDFA